MPGCQCDRSRLSAPGPGAGRGPAYGARRSGPGSRPRLAGPPAKFKLKLGDPVQGGTPDYAYKDLLAAATGRSDNLNALRVRVVQSAGRSRDPSQLAEENRAA
jgi:hypothetical protein